MATDRWDYDGVLVTTFAGPETTAEPDRRRVRIVCGNLHVVMTMREWASLVKYIGLVGNWPHAYTQRRDDPAV
jgi:hypothetical protein